MIEVKNLVKQYGDHMAVNDLSFTVEDGQIYGFLGPNGAGKSTTMNIITGCLAATQGEVLINGHDIYKEPREAKACIGYLPEIPPLYLDMTPREYLMFVAQIKGIAKAQRAEKVREVMEKTSVTDVQNRLIKNLSKGYRQRVGLAQAILGDPQFVILDEPTVGLDPAQIVEMRSLIKSLAPEHTVIFSSHILSEVSEICSQILIISGGKLVAEDTPENLESRFVTNSVLHISVNGAEDAVREALTCLEDVEGVEDVAVTADEAQQTVDVTITCSRDVDIKARLSKALAERDCYIVLLEEGKASLEDVFMELIAQDAAETAAASQALDDTDAAEADALDADALLRGEYRSVADEHEAFDAPLPDEADELAAEDVADEPAAEDVADEAEPDGDADAADDEIGQAEPQAPVPEYNGEEDDDDGSDV